MKKRFILILAFKYLKGHKLRAILTISGIAIGIGFITFLVSLGVGLKKVSTSQIANLEALRIIDATSGKSKIVTISNTSVQKIERLGEIEKISPSVSLPSRLELSSSAIEGVIYGKNLDYLSLEDLKVEKGTIYKSNDVNQAVVSTTALSQLGVKNMDEVLGKEIKVSFTIRQDLTEKGEVLKGEGKYKIVGIVKNDASYVYVPLNVLKVEGVSKYTNLKIMVSENAKVDSVKKKIENLGYKTTAIKNTVDQIEAFFNLFQLILLSFGLVAIVVASIGMFNTLTISLLEKTREIGFMKALGTTRKDIYRIFITESVLIGSLGGALGIGLGYMLGKSLNGNIVSLAEKTGNKAVEIFYLPTEFMIFIFLFAFTISFLTGLYPSFRASRINALDALRYE